MDKNPNDKAQSSNEIQSSNDKIKEEKSYCHELVEGLTFSHLTVICHLDFDIWALTFDISLRSYEYNIFLDEFYLSNISYVESFSVVP